MKGMSIAGFIDNLLLIEDLTDHGIGDFMRSPHRCAVMIAPEMHRRVDSAFLSRSLEHKTRKSFAHFVPFAFL